MRLPLFLTLRPIERLCIAGLALCALVMLTPFAFAQAATAVAVPSTSVNVSPLVDYALELTNGLVVPFLAGLAALVWRKVGLDKIVATAKMNEMLHNGLQRGVDALEGAVRDRLYRDGKPVTIDVHNAAVAQVADRLIKLSPDLLKRLKLTEEGLRELAAEKIRAWQGQTALLMEAPGLVSFEPASVRSAGGPTA